jgi:hypothetical protein
MPSDLLPDSEHAGECAYAIPSFLAPGAITDWCAHGRCPLFKINREEAGATPFDGRIGGSKDHPKDEAIQIRSGCDVLPSSH